MDQSDLVVLITAFLLGFVAGRFLSDIWWYRLRWAIKKRTPQRCPECGKWFAYREMSYATHRTAGQVLLCQKCKAAHYTPFTKEDDDAR